MDKNPYLPGTPDEFIEQNLGLARSEAWKLIKRAKQNENIKFDEDDILGIAYEGLVKAYKGFDPTRFAGGNGGQVKFSTYAVPTISGLIRRHITDFGRTIRKSRDGQGPDNIDSLDRLLNTDEDAPITLGDAIQSDNHKTDEQVIINDFLSQVDPRSRKIYLLRALDYSQAEIGKIVGLSQVRVHRIESQLYDLAQKYGGQEGVKMSRDISIENARRMRKELTTLEQFDAIGNCPVVAKHYGVSINTAYLFRKALIANGETGKEKPEFSELQNKGVEDVQGGVETSGDTGGYILPSDLIDKPTGGNVEQEEIAHMTDYPEQYEQVETVDDLEGLVEPEPVWNSEIGGPISCTLDETIEQKEKTVESELAFLSELYRKRADKDFKSRVIQMMEAI